MGFDLKHVFYMVWYPGLVFPLMVRLNRESKTHGLVLNPSLWLDIVASRGLELWFS